MVKARILGAAMLLVVMVLGCQKGNPNAPASLKGKVTYKGESVTVGNVEFYSKDSRVASCSINSDGTYYVPELPVGEFTVVIDNEFANPDKKMPEYKGAPGAGGAPKGMYPGKMGGPTPGFGTSKEAAKSSTPADAPKNAGTYVKLPASVTKPNSSTLKITVQKGENKQDLEIPG